VDARNLKLADLALAVSYFAMGQAKPAYRHIQDWQIAGRFSSGNLQY
jgi:hypothetical protein